jgi:hypothetical protein
LLINPIDNDIKVEVKTLTSYSNTKKWLILGVIASGLLVIPRRSSQKSDINLSDKNTVKTKSNIINSDQRAAK